MILFDVMDSIQLMLDVRQPLLFVCLFVSHGMMGNQINRAELYFLLSLFSAWPLSALHRVLPCMKWGGMVCVSCLSLSLTPFPPLSPSSSIL